MPVAFSEFEAACGDAGLHSRIVSAGHGEGSRNTLALYEPTHMFAAIGAAGVLLRNYQGEPLANTILPDVSFGDDVPTAVLRDLISDSITPAAKLGNGRDFTFDRMPAAGVCPEAEGNFDQVLRSFRDRGRAGCQVIIDSEPILIRKGKSHGEPTALTLVPMTINGVRIRPFSILGAHIDGDTKNGDRQRRGLEILGVDSVLGLGYMRPSALALPQSQRPDYFCTYDASTMWRWEGAAVRRVAAQVVRFAAAA